MLKSETVTRVLYTICFGKSSRAIVKNAVFLLVLYLTAPNSNTPAMINLTGYIANPGKNLQLIGCTVIRSTVATITYFEYKNDNICH